MSDTNVLDDHPLAGEAPARRERVSAPLSPLAQGTLANLDWRQALGAITLLAGVVAVFVAWFGVSGTLDPGKQMPYLVSGGLGGAALIAVGMTLFLSLEHARDRAALGDVLDRLEVLERRLERLSRDDGFGGGDANGRRGARASAPRGGR